MAIIRKPAVKTEPVDTISNFINQAPDGIKNEPQHEKKGVVKGQRQQITVTFDPDVIEFLDMMSVEEGVSRAALIRLAVKQLITRGTTVGGTNQ
jgi:Ribbon-helix-helix protein, copG family